MSKRNFILLIIVLIIIILAVFGFLFFNKPSGQSGGNTTGTNFFSQFNPFANVKPKTPVTTPVQTPTTTPTTTSTLNLKLKEVSSMPIAGFTIFSKERLVPVVTATTSSTTPPSAPLLNQGGEGGGNSSSATKKTTIKTTKPTAPPTEMALALRYAAKATGNIYETFADTIQEGQFSTTTIPEVYDAYFGNNGNSVVMRYLSGDEETIETFLGTLPKEIFGADTIANNQITGSLLPNNIKSISLSPDTSSMFYLFDSGDSMIGTTLNFTTNKKVQIFTSPFTEWSSGWGNSKIITLTTKPTSGIPGYVYEMDQTGKNLNQTLGNINGLTALPSPDGKFILYGDNSLNLNIYNKSTNTSTLLGVKTLPEKCVWNSGSTTVYCAVPKAIPVNQYPDAWYQGEVSFNDQFWKINVGTGNTTMLVDPITMPGGQEIDGIKLAVDSAENYLFFVNKKDSYLWEFSLK